ALILRSLFALQPLPTDGADPQHQYLDDVHPTSTLSLESLLTRSASISKRPAKYFRTAVSTSAIVCPSVSSASAPAKPSTSAIATNVDEHRSFRCREASAI